MCAPCSGVLECRPSASSSCSPADFALCPLQFEPSPSLSVGVHSLCRYLYLSHLFLPVSCAAASLLLRSTFQRPTRSICVLARGPGDHVPAVLASPVVPHLQTFGGCALRFGALRFGPVLTSPTLPELRATSLTSLWVPRLPHAGPHLCCVEARPAFPLAGSGSELLGH